MLTEVEAVASRETCGLTRSFTHTIESPAIIVSLHHLHLVATRPETGETRSNRGDLVIVLAKTPNLKNRRHPTNNDSLMGRLAHQPAVRFCRLSLRHSASTFAFALSCFLMMSAIPAFAYHTEEHDLITHQAVEEINRCYPGLVADGLANLLVRANLNEDYNILNKEIWYSHYYNPFKRIQMRRYDSSFRIKGLAASIAAIGPFADEPRLVEKLGHLIHHLQDATVPPHVVPVSHASGDGFENYKVDGAIASGRTCRQLTDLKTTDFQMLLRDTATQTLNSVDDIHWDVAAQTKLISFPLFTLDSTAFWVADQGNHFGTYGYLGNAFGSAYFQKDGASYYIPSIYYQVFKQRQMSLAVLSSARALLGTLLNQSHRLDPLSEIFDDVYASSSDLNEAKPFRGPETTPLKNPSLDFHGASESKKDFLLAHRSRLISSVEPLDRDDDAHDDDE